MPKRGSAGKTFFAISAEIEPDLHTALALVLGGSDPPREVGLSMSMNMNMNVLKEERNRGYLIAGIGAIVAFISFFLPYVSTPFGAGGSPNAATLGGMLWIVFILILASIALSALLIFRGSTPNPLGISGSPAGTQIRNGITGLIVAGGLGVLLQLINLLTGYGYGLLGNIGLSPTVGFYLLLLSLIAILVGGVMARRTARAVSSTQTFPPSQQWPSAQPPQWQQQQQYPPQQDPTQYAPPPQYGQQSQYGLPPQQYPPQYPPAQQPSEQQWPPSQQQQQQPPSQQPPWQ